MNKIIPFILPSILTLTLIGLIAFGTWLSLNTLNVGEISFLSIEDMNKKSEELDMAEKKLEDAEVSFSLAETKLDKAIKDYESAKAAYNNVTDEELEVIKEETKKIQYDIDWYWIVLGEYAIENNVDMYIQMPQTSDASVTYGGSGSDYKTEDGVTTGVARLNLVGTYANITNFVYEVENDNTLIFKLDNMKITPGYSATLYNASQITSEVSKDLITATFDIYDSSIVF